MTFVVYFFSKLLLKIGLFTIKSLWQRVFQNVSLGSLKTSKTAQPFETNSKTA